MLKRGLYTEATLATVSGATGYGLIAHAAIAIERDKIVYAGPDDGLPAEWRSVPATSLDGRLVTPGLIDCHTHLIHAGSRASEFEMRLEGASYEDVARAGGGIFSTVEATNQTSDDGLLSGALKRLDRMLAEGVTTVEVKSGYGLTQEGELRLLRVARKLSEMRPVRICTTFLGAHAIPKDMDGDEYLDAVCLPALRAAAAEGLVDAVDGFCETIGFSPAQIKRVFDVASELGLPVKLHAEQLSDQGGAKLASQYGALSADHLEYVSQDGVEAMAEAGTVAVMLPGAFYFLKETKVPPIAAFRVAGVPMAVATDSNPGSAPMTSILLAMNMATTLFAMTPEEALRGVTVNAARALGQSDIGMITPGQVADLAIWDSSHPAELSYRMGDAPLYARIFGGLEC